MNHSSLTGENQQKEINFTTGGPIYPNHCRNFTKDCNQSTIKKIDISKSKSTINKIDIKSLLFNNDINKIIINNKLPIISNYNSIKIIGTNLSYLFYGTKYAESFDALIKDSSYTIGIKSNDTYKNPPDIKNINIPITSLYVKYKDKNKKFNQLTKGEYCNYESYSAFNYHLKLDNNTGEPTSPYEKYNNNFSTGLFESILQIYNSMTTNLGYIINITICGLVGTICVLHSIIQGLLLWKLYYFFKNSNININFIYSLKGTLFLDYEQVNDLIYTKPIDALSKAIELIQTTIKAKYSENLSLINFDLLDFNGEYVGKFKI